MYKSCDLQMSLIVCAVLVPHFEKGGCEKDQRRPTKVAPGAEIASVQEIIK